MEAIAALKNPPPVLERVVLPLIPPAVRETVAGDLCELYRSPSQYMTNAMRTIPFVVASQIHRTANIPVLVMQGSIIFACYGGFASSSDHVVVMRAAAITLVLISALLLFDAYQGEGPPSAKRSILEAIAVSASVLVYAYGAIFALHAAHQLRSDELGWSLFMWLILPFGMPTLCGLRAAIILARERRECVFTQDMSPHDLAEQYICFERHIRHRNRVDIGLLTITAGVSAFFYAHFALLIGTFGSGITIIYAIAGGYLLFHGAAQPLPQDADFVSLRNAYQHELSRQHQLRSFTFWLYPAPILLAFYGHALEPGAKPAQPVLMVYAVIATVFLCFLIAAINRERSGQVRETIGFLCRMRERRPA